MANTTVIKNVLVFDGEQLSGPSAVVIDGAKIGDPEAIPDNPTIIIDGTGCTLLPGLFDCHVHVDQPEQLADCAAYGVTTVCDMACQPLATYEKMKASSSPVTWVSAGLPAFAANSTHGKMFRLSGMEDMALRNVDDVVQFVKKRVDEQVDYIKIIADIPGHDQSILNQIQQQAKEHGKMTVAHAAQYESFERSLKAGFDIFTHTPLDKVLDEEITDEMVKQKTIAVPTLTMMEGFTKSWILWLFRGTRKFQIALDSVKAMHQAGVPILAGTDANNLPIVSVPRGISLHYELELLVQAGLTPIETLRSATSLAAHYFSMADRGRISTGLRADLVLVRGNPVEDIRTTRNIKKVWIQGEEMDLQREKTSSCTVM